MVARQAHNLEVSGSIPLSATKCENGFRSQFFYAKVAQLVEHDLAKVGVAGSSPVFRSHFPAQMAESVDALVSNTSGAIHPGSIPGLGTYVPRRW